EPRENPRNGTTKKTVRTGDGEVEIEVPRDRKGTFDPQIVKKGQRRLSGFDDHVLSLYSRGMSTRDIRSHLSELYGTDVSPELISKVTDAVSQDVQEWRKRPLAAIWPIVYMDALVLRVREGVDRELLQDIVDNDTSPD